MYIAEYLEIEKNTHTTMQFLVFKDHKSLVVLEGIILNKVFVLQTFCNFNFLQLLEKKNITRVGDAHDGVFIA